MDYEGHIHKLQAKRRPKSIITLAGRSVASASRSYFRILRKTFPSMPLPSQPNTLINLSYFNIPKRVQGVVTVY
ncbi:hypothetical protein FVEG_01824 [Fusarium verticillioides 7600]|uniref:Uncharacterized protein n=1 Tax=Gibberella moniliformis (strain M3125 / FGSC 7600) TaxID=334819 RepID=W7LGX4_GIBM7|nr:hypothetical protein FVEG_01824 [Fusarium verticillioides 7600]EWG38653.1 hypothetical protein FVEG_01824 [Fusarium verticillioides 7600]